MEILGFVTLPTLVLWAVLKPHRSSTRHRVIFVGCVVALGVFASRWLAAH